MSKGEGAVRLVYISGVSAFTGEPFVTIELHRDDGVIEAIGQMTPDEARRNGAHAASVAAAAEHDAMLVAVMREELDAPVEMAEILLRLMRDRRGRASGATKQEEGSEDLSAREY